MKLVATPLFFLLLVSVYATTDWTGTWTTSGGMPEHCSPASPVIITQASSTLTVSWTWENSPACQNFGSAGVSVTETLTAPSGTSIDLIFQIGNNPVNGQLSLYGDVAIYTCIDGATQVFYRGDTVNWAGTWTSNGGSSEECLPANLVTLTQASYIVTASWTWDNSSACQEAGRAGSPFIGSVVAPRGNSIDIASDVVNGQLVLDGEEATFTSIDGNTITFSRNGHSDTSDADEEGWTGTWTSNGGPEGHCIPVNPVILSQNSTTVNISWTWGNTSACQNYGLAGSPYNGSVYVLSTNSLDLEFEVNGDIVDGILTRNGDQATFEGVDNTTLVFYRSESPKSASLLSLSPYLFYLLGVYWMV